MCCIGFIASQYNSRKLVVENANYAIVTKLLIIVCRSGMQDGDVITAIDGRKVRSTKDVMDALASRSVLLVSVRRGARTIELRVAAEEVLH